ncbi:MAG: GNAT family N-acetyltransferase [Clostridiales bacterium]|nr:GNAT family N-acetyltransferase [Clostridiales bacterium]
MLNGNLVKLRAYDSTDNPQSIINISNNSDVLENLRGTIPYPFTYEDEVNFIKSNSSSKLTYNFAIEALDSKEYIGGCGINALDLLNSHCTVGIFIGAPYLNKGYGTDAMKVLVHFIFENISVNKIKLHVFSFNKRAIRSYEKCAFKTEAILRKEIFRHGEYHDDIIMSIFREDYYAQIL